MKHLYLAASFATASALAGPPPAAAACHALVGGTVWLADGTVGEATVVIDGETISAVAADAAVPAGCDRRDVSGRVVTPGLIDPMTQLGLVEIDLEEHSVDHGAPAPLRAAFMPASAYNPRSSLIPITRLEGVTSALVAPSGDGLAAWVDLAGGSQAEAIQRAPASLHVHLGAQGPSRALRLDALIELLQEAAAYRKRESDWARNRSRAFHHPVRDLRAMWPVLEGTLPLAVHVDRAADIEALLRLTEPMPLRLVIVGGAEAWLLADALAARAIPVVVDVTLNAPESFDRFHARGDNAARLAAAGVSVLVSTFSTHNARKLRQQVGNAIREGLPRAAARASVTSAPAAAFGMREHGRLEAGARANVVVWSGDPFELSTAVVQLFIGGRDVELISRQTLLRDRYSDPGGMLVAPLPLR